MTGRSASAAPLAPALTSHRDAPRERPQMLAARHGEVLGETDDDCAHVSVDAGAGGNEEIVLVVAAVGEPGADTVRAIRTTSAALALRDAMASNGELGGGVGSYGARTPAHT